MHVPGTKPLSFGEYTDFGGVLVLPTTITPGTLRPLIAAAAAAAVAVAVVVVAVAVAVVEEVAVVVVERKLSKSLLSPRLKHCNALLLLLPSLSPYMLLLLFLASLTSSSSQQDRL